MYNDSFPTITMNSLQQIPLPLFYAASCVLGLAVGSFLNVVILRLPRMIEAAWRAQCREFLDMTSTGEPETPPCNLVRPGSSCPQCGRRITMAENIPVISYLLLGGRCKDCNNRISLRYPLVELLCAALTLLVAYRFGISEGTVFACLFTWALISLAFIDIDHQLLPDNITLPFLWLGLLCNWFGLFTDLHSSLLGAAAGYVIFWLVMQVFKLITGRDGLGAGDLKLLAMLGAWVGWQALATIIFLSSVVGSLVGLYLVFFRGRQRSAPISFGPYLACAGWLCLVWGLDIFAYPYLPGAATP